jgi:suppressor for copper-sensitivity B
MVSMIRTFLLLLALFAGPGLAATSPEARGNALAASLVTAEDGTSGRTVSAGLRVVLDEGWKTYWRSPGEVGLPPALDWSESGNVADVTLAFPAPTRFEAFGIENFGYGDEVVFPLSVTLEEPGAPVSLRVSADLLVCADVCIPETVDLALDLPAGGGVDASSAALLADWVARVPGGAETGIALEAVHLDDDALTLRATSATPFDAPDVFPERGPYAAFGKPELRLSGDGRVLWASLPVLAPGEGDLDLTITDSDRAATLAAKLAPSAPAPPAGGPSLLWIVAVAALGGLVLNLMPCVLPVLSIKLAAALEARDRPPARVRAGFLASAAGILAFFAVLAAALMGLRAAGVSIGWGVQFQQPVFLALVIGLATLFAANLFGAFEIGLGTRVPTAMAGAAGGGGLRGDFATGAFAALMATPCSAPFIGTAVTYALTSGSAQIAAVFAAMGLGLALPLLAVAAAPRAIRLLPRPGRWMGALRAVLGSLMLLAVVWLLSVLAGAAGPRVALVVGALSLLMLAALFPLRAVPVAVAGLLAVTAAATVLPPAPRAAAAALSGPWQPFSRDRIAAAVAGGQVVFVDVTADWCLTCVANKRLVLSRGAVAEALKGTVALQADWTRPDPAIAAFLEDHGRFGIPFNAVYGPGAPEGITLPELLTEDAVLDAIARARG